MKTELYRGFKIEADEYCDYSKYYWSVYSANGTEIGSTLWHDDRPFASDEEAIAAGKEALDEMLNCGNQGYFATGPLFSKEK